MIEVLVYDGQPCRRESVEGCTRRYVVAEDYECWVEERVVGRGRCIVELNSVWAAIKSDIESIRLVAVAKLG